MFANTRGALNVDCTNIACEKKECIYKKKRPEVLGVLYCSLSKQLKVLLSKILILSMTVFLTGQERKNI